MMPAGRQMGCTPLNSDDACRRRRGLTMRRARAGLRLVAVAVFAVLAGCATSSERIVSTGDTFVVAAGEQVRLVDGTTLEYRRVLADSRCSPGVQCIWAGRAEVEFGVTPPPATDGAESVTADLLLVTDSEGGTAYGGWQFQLVKLGFETLPLATLRVDRQLIAP